MDTVNQLRPQVDASSREPYLFISHASADKENPLFAALLRRLIDGGDVPLGIDTPAMLEAYGLSEDDFAWRLPRHEPYPQEITNAITTTSCATLVVLSDAYLKEATAAGGIPWMRWQELNLAVARARQKNSNYKVFYAWLEDLSQNPKLRDDLPTMNAARIYLGEAHVDGLERDILELFSELRRTLTAPDAALSTYLTAIVQKYERIPLFGFRHRDRWLALEQIYAALRGNLHVAAEERDSAFLDFESALVAYKFEDEEGREDAVRALIVDTGRSQMRGLGAGPTRESERPAPVGLRLTLADATRTLRRLVLLGGPGSGKTTVAQWLALTYARGMLTDPTAQVSVPMKHVDPDSDSETPVVIGAPRVPILVRIQEYAEAFVQSGAKLPLIDFIGRHDWRPAGVALADFAVDPGALSAAFARELAQGRVVIILDGLDEIIDPKIRRRLLQEIEALDVRYIRSEPRGVSFDHTRYGNQLIVTTRIVGYDTMSLPKTWRHVTIEEMSDQTVRNYWMRLFNAISTEAERTSVAADVGRLHSHVFGGANFGISQLARVPLLATIIAAAYDDRNRESLPDYRVEIYQGAVKVLVEQWRETGVSSDEWSKVLAPIAYRMHDQPGESMLKESELRRELAERLAELHSLSTEAARRDAVNLFMERVNKHVGLLAARRPGIFAFLHRTFQEYLAAQYLVEKPALAFDRIRRKWRSPRWREVILLAFGWIGLPDSGWTPQERNELLQQMLRQARTDNLARPLLLLADGVAEIPTDPSGEAVSELFVTLALLAESGTADFADGCAVVAGRAPNEALKALVQMLSTPDQSRAAANLILRENWFNSAITDALEAAEAQAPFDTALVIQSCLRRAAQSDPKATLPPPKAPSRLSSDDETALARKDPSAFRQLRLDTAEAEARYRNDVKRFRARASLGRAERYRRRTPLSKVLSTHAARQTAADDFGWCAVLAGIFGGLDDLNAIERFKEYALFAQFLQREDVVRTQVLEFRPEWRVRFGPGDTVLAMAVALDEGIVSEKDANTPPGFNLDWAVGGDEVPASIREALEKGQNSSVIVAGAARKLWPKPERAILTLASILADTTGALRVDRLIAPLDRAERRELGLLVERALRWTADSCFRALHKGLAIDAISASHVPEPAKSLSARVAIETAVRQHPTSVFPIGTAEKLDRSVQAEGLLAALSGQYGDDITYNIAVLMDTVPRKFRDAISYANEASVAPWLETCADWPVSDFAPLSGTSDDIPIPMEDIADTSPLERLTLEWRSVLFEFIQPNQPHPDLRRYLATRALDMRFAQHVNGGGAPEYVRLDAAVAAAYKIESSYYRARALLRLYLRTGRTRLMTDAYAAAVMITDASQRALTMERIAAVGATGVSNDARKHAIRASGAISDPRDAWRLRMRLAEAIGGSAGRRLRRSAIAALAKVRTSWESTNDIWTLTRLSGPAIVPTALRRKRLGSDDNLAIAARAGNYRTLIGAHVTAKNATILLPIYVARACFDIVDEMERSSRIDGDTGEQLWKRVGRGDLDALDTLIVTNIRGARKLNEARAKKIAMAARKLSSRRDKAYLAQFTRLLPQLDTRGAWAATAARTWMHSTDDLLQAEAAVIIASHHGIYEAAVFKHLARTQRNAPEAQALRACNLLASGSFWITRPPPSLLSSQVEPAMFDELANALVEKWTEPLRSENYGKAAIRRFASDIMIDDASHFSQLIERGEREEGIRELISNFGRAETGVIDAAVEALATSSQPLADSIVNMLTASAREYNFERWNGPGIHHVANAKYCPSRVSGVAASISAAFGSRVSRTASEAIEFADRAARHFRHQEIATVGVSNFAGALSTRSGDFVLHSTAGWMPVAVDKTTPAEAMEVLFKAHGAKPCIDVLVAWLKAISARPATTREEGLELLYVAFAAEVACRQSPDSFWRAVSELMDADTFAAQLRDVGLAEKTYGFLYVPTLRILATGGRLDAATLDRILVQANTADSFAQNIVEHALRFITDISQDSADRLVTAHKRFQPRIAALATRIATFAARDTLAKPALRQRIVEGLNEITLAPEALQSVWRFVPGSEKTPGIVERVGTLRDAAADALTAIDRGL